MSNVPASGILKSLSSVITSESCKTLQNDEKKKPALRVLWVPNSPLAHSNSG